MARKISEIQSLPFYQIIGAPLLALVQGQAQAAQATAEFIEQVGFGKPRQETGSDVESTTSGSGDEAGSTVESQSNDSNDSEESSELGKLRMARFTYRKPGDMGELVEYQAEVPILSLVPIPSIEIKEADLEFFIKVTDIQTETIKTAVSGQDTELAEWLAQGRVGFRAAMGKMETTTAGERRTDLQMRVHMKVGQSDIPVGMEHLFRFMDQSISGGPVPESIEPTETPVEAVPSGETVEETGADTEPSEPETG